MVKFQELGSRLPHALNDHKNQRATIVSNLLARHRSLCGHKQRSLYHIATGDEKWCLYVNMKQRKE